MATVTITYQEYEELKKAATINVELMRNETIDKLQYDLDLARKHIIDMQDQANRPWHKKLFYSIAGLGERIVK